jgi:hypothetical protein
MTSRPGDAADAAAKIGTVRSQRLMLMFGHHALTPDEASAQRTRLEGQERQLIIEGVTDERRRERQLAEIDASLAYEDSLRGA